VLVVELPGILVFQAKTGDLPLTGVFTAQGFYDDRTIVFIAIGAAD
jgi:hypothetical protein